MDDIRVRIERLLLAEKVKQLREKGYELEMRSFILDAKQKQLEYEYRYNHNHDSKGRFTYSHGSGLTNPVKNDTIVSRGEVVALEIQRYGRNKDTLVNKTYIESGEYRRKFDNITDDAEVNKALYESAKKALLHRSGTALEDMYWIDGSGKVLCSETDQKIERKVIYSGKTKKLVEKTEPYTLAALHNHPSSMPPSDDDLNSVFNNKYKFGVIACHNGTVYKYSSKGLVDTDLYNAYIADALSMGKTEFEAQTEAVNKFVSHGIVEIEVF